ncbi:hypothetical protein Peternella1_18 [Winogradskyella phage Peternella_1]|uniref:Uncharacterized protein n=1 Tax=Winogradskyella phage Peternella_1 TaxID=2745699 RepID=A0A8E5EBN0_9CAUD|nr:hypothetical protein M1M32_gp18 [Winogradskyella phage Peternella_1]QQV91554.1 hypothetical protein Peternella1_18 [Winogradskyella phage Peternella_1]
MQSKKQSFTEALSNTAVGFIVSYISTFLIFPLVGFTSSPGKNLIITCYFTIVSILRGYVIRRWFNNKGSVPKIKRVTCPDGSDFMLHCFECEIEMPVNEKNNNYFCSNCGLRH